MKTIKLKDVGVKDFTITKDGGAWGVHIGYHLLDEDGIERGQKKMVERLTESQVSQLDAIYSSVVGKTKTKEGL